MHLVQLLLPLYDNDRRRLGADLFRQVRDELTGRFGGLTAYTRAPAEGLWKESSNAEDTPTRDDIVILEVMTDALDRAWWRDYRCSLEARFRQERIVVRAEPIEML